MKPPPPPSDTNNRRKRPELSPLPLPQRKAAFALAVPLPLPLPPPTTTTIKYSDLHRQHHIGSGSGGSVYKVLHRPTGASYALKVIYGNPDESARRQICREIHILRTVDNSHVVKCHGMFDEEGDIRLLLEYMDGGSLQGTCISHEPSLASLARQILSGLSYLHRRRIVHRDIKPSNFLVNSCHTLVKIADFGVSRTLSRTMDPCQSAVGTIAYMSPERIDTDLTQGAYDGCAADIWSFGVSLLELYLGRFPFGATGDWAALMCAICMSRPPEPPPSASPHFRHFLASCLHKDPAARWTALQLLRHPFITCSFSDPTPAPPKTYVSL
ncbi:hypothetical protein Syun_010846 [Stephania yunnanensis]|uniref:mitogen-activated protein kinase kinase n=1 Tax=Stephania yunnanensis TaxID=152371 RepID=A0AAP0PHX6_9MAGN